MVPGKALFKVDFGGGTPVNIIDASKRGRCIERSTPSAASKGVTRDADPADIGKGRRLFGRLVMSGVFVIGLGLSALPALAADTIPSNFFTVIDVGGANDINSSQVDMTQMGRDDTDPTYYKLFWSWDATDDWTGTGQTGDACALFGNDGDEFVDRVVCVQITNPGASTATVQQTTNSPYVFNCSNKKEDRCTNPKQVAPETGQVLSGGLSSIDFPKQDANLITGTDPFPELLPDQNWQDDSSIQIWITKALVGTNATLLNVCSYPSAGNGGNNNPFDCIVRPGAGYLKIVKSAPATPTATFDFTVNPGNISKSINNAGETAAFVVDFGTYSISETIPTPWKLNGVVCTIENPATETGNWTPGGSSITGVEVKPGLITTCTFTNVLLTGQLTVSKHVINDNGGTAKASDWTMNLGGTAGGSVAGSEDGMTKTFTVGTTFAVTEIGDMRYYTASSSDGCIGTIEAGNPKNCTITNDDNAPSLKLFKTVTNNNGGQASSGQWTLTATGPSTFSGNDTGSGVTYIPPVPGGPNDFKQGTYTLSETGPSGYSAKVLDTSTQRVWECTGDGIQDGNQITLEPGQNAVCTITNEDNPPSLKLFKKVKLDHGGLASPGDWTLTATGPSTFSGQDTGSGVTYNDPNNFKQGTYTLSETGPSGYSAVLDENTKRVWECTGDGIQNGNQITLELGQKAECTIINEDDAPSLTLKKIVNHPYGRTETAKEWTLTATGPTTFSGNDTGSGVTYNDPNNFKQGTYMLSENGPSGYKAKVLDDSTQRVWECTGTGTQNVNEITLMLGQKAVCTIINEDQPETPTGTTVQSWVLHDSITINGIRRGAPVTPENPAATVTFKLYDNQECTGDPIGDPSEEVVDVSYADETTTIGEAETVTGVPVTETGFYYWVTSYSGDAYNAGFVSNCEEVTQIQAKDFLVVEEGKTRNDLIEPVE